MCLDCRQLHALIIEIVETVSIALIILGESFLTVEFGQQSWCGDVLAHRLARQSWQSHL